MSLVIMRTLLENKLNTITPAISTAWENVPFTPANGVPYQRVNLLVSDIKNPCINDKMFETVGFLQVTLSYPIGTASKNAYTRADLIEEIFYYGLVLVSGAIKVRITKTPVTAPAIINGDRYELPVTIYFAVAKYPT
jgi:hypothetical protein